MISVPQLDDPHLKELIKLMGLSSKPIYVSVEPEDFARISECFPAIEEKIKREGGSRLLGWQIWKSDILIEAEFHAIWKSQNNDLIDITPKVIPITPTRGIEVKKILFLPDKDAKYTGAQVNNSRLNITQNSLVDDFITMAKTEFKILNKGKRAFEYAVSFSQKEAEELNQIRFLKDMLQIMAQKGMTKDSDCFCGSNEIYKNCCYKKINDIAKNTAL